jgi:hypothetical protein
MTRTAIRHTLSALATAVLVSAFASSPASADERQHTILEPTLKSSQATVSGSTKTPKGLATKKGHSQRAQRGRNEYSSPGGKPVPCDCSNCSSVQCHRHYINSLQGAGGP